MKTNGFKHLDVEPGMPIPRPEVERPAALPGSAGAACIPETVCLVLSASAAAPTVPIILHVSPAAANVDLDPEVPPNRASRRARQFGHLPATCWEKRGRP